MEGKRFTRECGLLIHTEQVGTQGMVAMLKAIDSLWRVVWSSIPNS